MAPTGIAHLRDRPPYRLSGGEKKRVALASVIVLDPDVLLSDEPTSTLDPRSQSQVIDLIQEWKRSSKTLATTATHQLEIVDDIASRVLVLEEGRVGATGAPAEILANYELLLRADLVHAHRHSHGRSRYTAIRICILTRNTNIRAALEFLYPVAGGARLSGVHWSSNF